MTSCNGTNGTGASHSSDLTALTSCTPNTDSEKTLKRKRSNSIKEMSISTQPESVKRWVFGRLDEQGLTKDLNWRTYDVMLKEPYRRQILRDRVDRLRTLDFTIPLFDGATQGELREFGDSINDIQTQFNEAATQSAGRMGSISRTEQQSFWTRLSCKWTPDEVTKFKEVVTGP
ncbi:hypothetical protein BDV41DRAFT_579988 [Aspergillus transmontanensis]|uniref:Uncharacterized protein n=1 Tax=Aspergillus transmontanensis TaxID=1034304 RepID=A0A5N6VN55_9EURO|nr:hypothetical protein BDV41DRAFT_579988 [Aspergillus transmontanensis]